MVEERRKAKAAKMAVVNEMRKKEAERVRKWLAEAEEAKAKVEAEKQKQVEEKTAKQVRQAVEETRAVWEAREKEVFRIGWHRGQRKLVEKGGRMARGMSAHFEVEEAWRVYQEERR